jgi:hypothetical protein
MRVAQKESSREADLYGWLLHQATTLRLHKPDFIDWSELAEELEEIVALARKEVVSGLRTVLMHLLKWKYQTTARNEVSWQSTIVRERLELELLLGSQNLRKYLSAEGYALAYRQARRAAGTEMRLERVAWEQLFPPTCEWDLDRALDPDFFPPFIAARNSQSH